MPLTNNVPIAFIPIRNAETARRFYEDLLGLTLVKDDQFALVFRLGNGSMLRVVRAGEFTPAPFTIFGWETSGLEAAVDELTAKGLEFVRFSFFQQDERGIWQAPDGSRVAWFKDPDGNTLSLSEHTAPLESS